jgi:hypothetical protein
MAVLPNNLLENEPPPRISARAGQEFRHPVHAQACRFSGGRSANRYMKDSGLRFLVFLFAVLSLVTISRPGLAQQAEVIAAGKFLAPTGTYAPVTSRPDYSSFALINSTNEVPLFTLRLETNGTYIAEALRPPPRAFEDLVGSHPDVRRGTWRWDAQRLEFQLEPGDFVFYLKRLPLDKRDPNRLVWGSSFLERQRSK